MEGLGLRKGAWTREEDELLKQFIEIHGEGKWHRVPIKAGLNRCRKSCRLRWLNYLKPNIKRGEFAEDEIDLIIRLHKLLGNRWSLIAGRLPGRTANDVKNYWNTHRRKKNQKMASYAKILKDKSQEDMNPPVVVIRPRPRTFIKRLRCSERCANLEHNHSEENYTNGRECPNLEHNHSEENYTNGRDCANLEHNHCEDINTNGREFLPAAPPQTLHSENVIDWWEQLSQDGTNSTNRIMCSGLGLEDDFFTNFWVEDMVQLASIDDHYLGNIDLRMTSLSLPSPY